MHRNRGFTLVELLVYAAIFAIVAGLLTTIFYTVINTQKKTSVSGEVSQQLNLVLTTVQRLVGDSSLVEAVYEGASPSSTCATFCTLKLRRTASSTDPTIISSDANGIYLQEGASPQVTLTTNKVLINHFRLTKQEIPGGHAVVEISTSFSYNTQNPTFAVTKAIESAIARVNAATFDADLIPNQDNTFDIGQIGANLRWKNGRFSGDVTVAGNVGIGTASPAASALLDLTSTAKGFLPPRMTTAQRDAIGSLTAGLFIYNTTTNEYNLYNGTSWGAVGNVGWAASSTNIYSTNSGSVGIGTSGPSYKLDVSGTGRFTGDVTLGDGAGTDLTVGGGSGKINAGTIDPIYTIGGKKYATYVSGMVGQKEEHTGTVELQCGKKSNECSAVIDFANSPEGSDDWLFSRAADLKNNFGKVIVLLSPSFNGKVWYEKDPRSLKLYIRGDHEGEVAYRLTAPRFDWQNWPSKVIDQRDGGEGFNLDKLNR